ncbi:MAG: glycosyltransferase, partial [Dysgonamonadaceae bacterium]|nr:glycosyltransferase [Dysgonamonadaceae bacterium]
HEEFGFVAIEMMMHALPLIVTKTGGLDEIVEDNVSGLKVPVRTIKGKRQADVKLLQEKICLLLENPAQASELGENARKRFLEKYELSIFKEKMLNLYQTI